MNRFHCTLFSDLWGDDWFTIIDPDKIDLTKNETHLLTLLEGNYTQALALINLYLAPYETGEYDALRLDGLIDKRKNKLYTRLWRRRVKVLQAHFRSIM